MVIETIIVYTLLFAVMMMIAQEASKESNWRVILYAFFVYSVVFGIRYGVGTDHINYYELYNSTYRWGFKNVESGYSFIQNVFINLRMPAEFFFGCIAFIQIFLVFLPHKRNPDILPFMIFVFMMGCYWMPYMNLIRQSIAFSVIAYAITFIEQKKFWHYVLSIVVASLFHRSAIIFIVIYPIFNYKIEWFNNIKVQLVVLIASLLVMQFDIVGNNIDNLLGIFEFAHYDQYITSKFYFENQVLGEKVTWGIGAFIILLIHILIICSSNIVKKEINRPYLTIIYDLLFIGIIAHYIFQSSPIVQRLFTYFQMFEFIFLSYVLYVFTVKYKRPLVKISCIALICLLFAGHLYRMRDNYSAYYTVWQQDQFRKDHYNIR